MQKYKFGVHSYLTIAHFIVTCDLRFVNFKLVNWFTLIEIIFKKYIYFHLYIVIIESEYFIAITYGAVVAVIVW